MYSSTMPVDGNVPNGPAAVEHFDRDHVARAGRRGPRPASATAPARRRAGARAPAHVDDAVQLGGSATRPVIDTMRDRCAAAQARRHGAHRLGVEHAGQAAHFVQGARPRRGSTNVTVTSCRCTTLNCRSISTSIESRKNVPRTSIATAAAMPITEVAARTGCRPTFRRIIRTGADSQRAEPGALEPAPAVARRRLRPHRFGRRQRRHAADGVQRAESRGDEADRHAAGDHAGRQPVAAASESGRSRCRSRSCRSRARRRTTMPKTAPAAPIDQLSLM